MAMRPSSSARKRSIRPRGESGSSPQDTYVGQWGRQNPQWTQSSAGDRAGLVFGLGLGQAALEASIRYANERVQFGRPIAAYQAIAHKIADMATGLEAARALVLHSAWEIAHGKRDMRLASMAKLFATETANRIADDCTRIFGSYGFAMEFDAQRYFRDARFLLYGGGTSEILRTIIAKQMGVGKGSP